GRVGEKRLVVGGEAAAEEVPRFGLGDAPVSGVQFWIVAARDPSVGPSAVEHGKVAPGLAAKLALTRDGVETPGTLPGMNIKSGDVAALAGESRAAGQPHQDFVLNDDGAAGRVVRIIGGGSLPHDLAVDSVNGDHVRVA